MKLRRMQLLVQLTIIAVILSITAGSPIIDAASLDKEVTSQAEISPEPKVKSQVEPKRQSPHKHGMFKELADFLHMNPRELHRALSQSTLSEIALKQGISRQDLKTKLVELMKARASLAPVPLGTSLNFDKAAERLMDRKHSKHHDHRSRSQQPLQNPGKKDSI
ncbi:hypothetical protein [Paenibacillus lemnae]|uniref:Uncharacterized protein n=1 Tax=Paenibacillus lemnae TaxID=1330551 RepID=A0A848MEI8_PAELE|nr:hypothetical protein [Paenibacillus lemnae]NMO97804.1 hypothetical protein [Paenibacillus lemnae]